MAKPSKKTRRLLFNLAFVVILVTITLVILFVNQKDELNIEEIGNYFKNGNPVWIVGAFVCMLLFILFEGIGLFILARFFGAKPNIVSATAYSAANSFYSAITPTGAGGQPAEVYYMSRDGMSPGKASFAILLNTIGYAAAIFFIGIAAMCINPGLFGGINTTFAKVLVVAGGVVQAVLLGLYIGCMYFGRAITKLGKGLITILYKIKIVKKPDKWYAKIEEEVRKYGECRKILKEKPLMLLTTLIFNILQRTAQTLIPCFVCLAVDDQAPFLDIFVLQALVLFGYNATPLPGGVGAYEYLFMNIYGQMFPGQNSFLLLILMISRLFSYYLNLLISGVFTLTYHMVKVKKVPEEEPENSEPKEGESPPDELPPEEITEGEPMEPMDGQAEEETEQEI